MRHTGIVLLGATTLAFTAQVAGDEAAEYLPGEMLIAITVETPDRHLASIRDFLEARDAARDGLETAIGSNAGLVGARVFLTGVAATAGTDLWTAGGAVLGRELVVAVQPRGEQEKPALIIATLSRDDGLRTEIIDTLHAAAGITVNGRTAPGIALDIDGVEVLRIGDGFECRIGDALLISNDRVLLERSIEAHQRGTGRLVDDPTWQHARTRVPDEAVAWARLHMPTVRGFMAGQAGEGIAEPLNGLLFGGWSHAIAHAEDVVSWLSPDDAPGSAALTLHLDVPTNERDPALDGFVAPGPDRVAPVRVPDAIAMISTDRSWADLFSERERFLTLSGSSQLANFTATMTTLTGGLDFAEDVLGNVTGPVQVVVRAAERAAAFRPSPPIPAFALVAPIDVARAPNLAQRLTSGALSTASVVNMDQTQKGGEGYLVDVEEYRGHRLVTMQLAAPPADGDEPALVDIRYNFSPASGVFGDRFVIASTRDAAIRVADAILDDERVADAAQDRIRVDADRVVTALRDARDELIAQRMVKENQSQAEAARDIDGILALVALADSLEVDSTIGADAAHARARLSFAASQSGNDR